MELSSTENMVLIPSRTEIVFCTQLLNNASYANTNTSTDQEEINGFGLKIYKRIYPTATKISLNQLSSTWLLFDPSEELKMPRNDQINGRILLEDNNVTLAFGSLISPYQFKCAELKFLFEKKNRSRWNIFFVKQNSSMSINIDHLRFNLKRDHIDSHRGVIIDVKSTFNIIVHICLQGNLDEYTSQNGENGYLSRRFYLQNIPGEQYQPCFSAMHLSIRNTRNNSGFIHKILCRFIQFFSHHSIPIFFGSINFSYTNFIYQHNLLNPSGTFICQYAWQMLNSVGCRMFDQMVNNRGLNNDLIKLANINDDLFYYIMERLRRLALSSENYFLDIVKELPGAIKHYYEFYLNSIFHRMDMDWDKYVRIPWFCFTPTRRIVKPFKFMQSNRVFRYISNVSQSMAFVEFRDDTGSAFLSKELVSFLKHYLEYGFQFGGRHYVYLHHAQSQIRNKQFYFYCEKEGGMTREELEDWMGNFDDEKLPAKNTARRTQPFSSTEATIEIKKQLVATIPDIKTADGKYNFTDGVGQISSQLNLLVHKEIGVDADEGEYTSSVLQIRYGGCKGTVAVNPYLDGKTKQLLIRKSMDKFECNHQILELCKRSLRRRLCLNHEVINLLSYRGISSECLLVFQLRNILWLMSSLVSNQSALSVLREKILHVLPWAEISHYPHLSKEPFFRQLLHTTISNNLHQLVTRAHIRVPDARYMFGIVDEYKVLNEGEVFVQITDDDGTKTVLEGFIAITKNPCHHPGDLRVLKAVNQKSLHHLYDVLVFPQQGSRPHASEISGSDLDGDEYTVIWDPKLVPTSINPDPYDYDSGPAPTPLNRIVTRDDRLKVILDICEQDNLGRLSNIHLLFVDKSGIDSEEAVSLAGGLSQELDSVKSGQHPYTPEEIKKLNSIAGTTRPDFIRTSDYNVYPSDKILGKLFRSADRLTNAFSKAYPITNNPVYPDPKLLHKGYEKYIHFAQELYQQYQKEMLEVISAYGFSNEIDLFSCIESRNMKANERSDIQQTAQKLLKEVFKVIRKKFFEVYPLCFEARSKAAACYYVAYTDKNSKDKRMLSFPWLFASQLLGNYSVIPENEEETDYMEKRLNFHARIYNWLKQKAPFIVNLCGNNNYFTWTKLFDKCFQKACNTKNERMINRAERLIELFIDISKSV